MKDPTLFDKIGLAKLRAVVARFYDVVLSDMMIGFMFKDVVRTAGKQHLIDREVEFVAGFLGAPDIKYIGRPMRTAHARHQIFGGQFERRLQILREAMAAEDVDPEVQAAWIAHTNALRSQITRDAGSECGVSAPPPLAIAPTDQSDRPIKLGRR